MFSSIDNNIYKLLDNLIFINTDIISKSSISKMLGENSNSGLLLICNSLILGFIVYYAINYLISNLTYSKIDSPKQFIFKSIIFLAIMNSSLWICEQIINIIYLITQGISYISYILFGYYATFSNFIERLNTIFSSSSNLNVFSFDGIIKSFVSFGLISLILTYSLRYIMIQVFILLSPFAFLSLILNSTEFFFKLWLRNFISLLITQIFISIILLLSFSFTNFSNTFNELLYIGIIFALTKTNSYIRELFGGISTSVNIG